MNLATEHILKQVEWLNRLKSDYGCSFVECEHPYLGRHFRADVYGKTQNGEIFIVEVGRTNENELKALKRLTGRKHHITLILVNPLSRKCSKLEKKRIARFSQYSWVKVI